MGKKVKIVIPVLFIGAAISVNGCSKRASDMILAEIGPEKVYVSDYERMMVKNSGGWEAAKETSQLDKEKFLDLLVKYRLKVLDAYRNGLDKDPEISREMQGYAKSLATSFLLDKEIVHRGVRQMYERRKEELRASHILINASPEAGPEDTHRAWNTALDVLKRAQSGEDFAALAAEFSDDRAGKVKGGDVYYFTSGLMAPQFEDACYQLKAGQIYPQPVRTQFGYHVIKLTDRRPNRWQIRASHIMIRLHSTSPSPEDTLIAHKTITLVQDSIKGGADFAELAIDYSEDMGSATRGGDLGFFERRRTIQPFDEAAFSLKVGEVSPIVRTPYGYHLIKVTEEKPLPPFAVMKQTIREAYQNSRQVYDYENLLRRYRRELNFSVSPSVLDMLLTTADSTKLFSAQSWYETISPGDRQKQVIGFGTESVSLDSVLATLKGDTEFSNMVATATNLHKAIDRVGERALMSYKARNVASEFPDYKRTLKEYEEGILLYKSEQQQVWSKVSTSDSLLRSYFEQNREKYTLPDRVSFIEIFTLEDSSHALQLLDSVKAGVDFSDFAIRRSQRPNVEEHHGEWQLRLADENVLTRKAMTMEIGQVSEPIRYEGGYSIIKVTEKEPSRPKTYEEAAPDVARNYHDYTSARLEEEWLSALRKEFKVKVQAENLQAAFTETPPAREE